MGFKRKLGIGLLMVTILMTHSFAGILSTRGKIKAVRPYGPWNKVLVYFDRVITINGKKCGNGSPSYIAIDMTSILGAEQYSAAVNALNYGYDVQVAVPGDNPTGDFPVIEDIMIWKNGY